jgi:MYXO-CTERM domain-containing protein
VPDCAGRACGDDGCGGSCGACPFGTVCSTVEGQCVLDPNGRTDTGGGLPLGDTAGGGGTDIQLPPAVGDSSGGCAAAGGGSAGPGPFVLLTLLAGAVAARRRRRARG